MCYKTERTIGDCAMTKIKKPARNADEFIGKAHQTALKTYYDAFTFFEKKRLVDQLKLNRGFPSRYNPSALERALLKAVDRQFKNALEQAGKYWGQLEICDACKTLGLSGSLSFTDKQFIDYFIAQRGEAAYYEEKAPLSQ